MTEAKSSSFSRRQQIINLLAGIVVFGVNSGISFFLTPFIVEKLGPAAYGFIGLSSNIISYAGFLTIAINSMAGRFVTIEVHSNNLERANIYISSVFYANVIFSVIIMSGVLISGIFLEKIIHIPENLIIDVKGLYLMLGVTSCLSLFTGIYGVSTFIENRLDISHIRNIIGNILRGVLLFVLFSFFTPEVWYYGLTSLIMSIYLLSTNIAIYHKLTPFLKISRGLCKLKVLLQIAASGVWNIVNKVSNLLTRGCELLLADLYVSAASMGLLSISMTMSVIILSFVAVISSNFAPILTRLYSIGDKVSLKQESIKSIRFSGFICAFPLAIMYAFGDYFFQLWVPGQNIELLYVLLVVGSFELIFGMPLEPLWNIFTITNRVKVSSLFQLINAILTFGTVIAMMYISENEIFRIIVIAGVHSIYCVIRNITFLPIFGARCLNFGITTFYPELVKSLLNTSLLIALGFGIKLITIKHWFVFDLPHSYNFSWWTLIFMSLSMCLGWLIISNIILLKTADRLALISKIKKVFSKNHL